MYSHTTELNIKEPKSRWANSNEERFLATPERFFEYIEINWIMARPRYLKERGSELVCKILLRNNP